MRHFLILMSAFVLMANVVFSQVDTYPWTEDFESGDFATNGWTTNIISGVSNWQVEGSTLYHSGLSAAKISNNTYEQDTAELVTPTFVRPSGVDTLRLSFWLINSSWSSDVDHMILAYSDGVNDSILMEVTQPHEEWRQVEVILPVENLAETFCFKFIGVPKYGHGFYIDDVVLEGYVYVPPTIDSVETDEYLQIGTANMTGNIPVDPYYGCSYTQQIFGAIEMGGARTIYSLGFYNKGSEEAIRRNVSVSLGHASKAAFESSTDWVSSSVLTQVYSGNMDLYTNEGWVYVVFDEPFEYNGTDNLIVAVSDTTEYGVYFSVDFSCSSSYLYDMSICHIASSTEYYDVNDMSLTDGTVNSVRNNIRFGLVPMEVPAPVYDVVETQGYLQVGTDFTTQDILPISTYYNYSYSQQIYDAEEMGSSRTIYSLSINYVGGEDYATPDATTRNVALYLGYTSKDDFNNNNDWFDVSEFTEVFDGDIQIKANAGWVTFTFDEPFEYVDTANLVVVFADRTGSYDLQRFFACSKVNFAHKSLFAQNDGQEYDVNNFEEPGDLYTVRNNMRFGLVPVVRYEVSVVANDPEMGVVEGGGLCMQYEGVTVSATAYPGFQFNGWADGSIENPRFILPNSDTTIMANFSALTTDTVYFDNDVFGTPLGFHGDHVEWGIRISPKLIAARTQLADVVFYVDGEYAFGRYDLNVYQGEDTIPSVSILHDSIVVDSAAQGWMNFGFESVTIDTTKSLWIILSNEGTRYPAIASTFVDYGFKDGAWWNSNGTWQQQSFGAWRLRAVLPYEEDDAVEEMFMESVSVYPNPTGDFFYIDGVESGSTVEIYNTLGSMLRSFTYEGGAVDFSGMPAGMYILRSDENVTRFVKE